MIPGFYRRAIVSKSSLCSFLLKQGLPIHMLLAHVLYLNSFFLLVSSFCLLTEERKQSVMLCCC